MIRGTLRRALFIAQSRGLVTRNVAQLVDPPSREVADLRLWTPDQCRAFLGGVEGRRMGALYQLAMYSGARIGELMGLHWEDVDWDHATLHIHRTLLRVKGIGLQKAVTKTTKSDRAIPLAPPIIQALLKHRESQLLEKAKAGTKTDSDPVHLCHDHGNAP